MNKHMSQVALGRANSLSPPNADPHEQRASHCPPPPPPPPQERPRQAACSRAYMIYGAGWAHDDMGRVNSSFHPRRLCSFFTLSPMSLSSLSTLAGSLRTYFIISRSLCVCRSCSRVHAPAALSSACARAGVCVCVCVCVCVRSCKVKGLSMRMPF
jgi:hypothetical protein